MSASSADREVEAGVDARPSAAARPASSARSISATSPARCVESVAVARSAAARGDDLEPFEQREDLDDRLARDRRDRGADVRDAHDQPLRLEQPQRLAHRDDADLELPREVVDDQARARAPARRG